MAQFIALVARNYERFTEEQFTPLLEPEAERARELYAAGTVRWMWGRLDLKGAVVLLETASLEEAEATMRSLPLAQAGMIDVTIVPLTAYRGFGPRG